MYCMSKILTDSAIFRDIKKENEVDDLDNPLQNFMFVLKAHGTRQKYPSRLKCFFDFGIDPKLSLEEQSQIFVRKSQDLK